MNRKEQIFKKIKQHLNYLKETHPNYNVIYIGLQGSQNYDLDIYSEQYESDVDTKAILVPSLKDISLNKKPVSTTVILPDNSHCDCKDIRLMFDNFKKQNINFIEILFTEFRIINPLYKDLILDLIGMGEDIAHLNENQALRCMAGMSMEKKKALCHPYPNLIEKIEKYGYDGKQLHHIIRMNDFIKAYTSGKSYKECLTTYNNKELLMDAKLSKFSLEEALKLSEEFDQDTKTIKDKFLKEEDEVNQDTLEKLHNLQYEIIKRTIELEILPKEEKKEIDPNQFPRVFVTSDIHFLHANVLKYETNRLKLVKLKHSDYIKKVLNENNINTNPNSEDFDSDIFNENFDKAFNDYYNVAIKEFDEEIIKLWNKTVNKDDLVYILGDIALNYSDIYDVNNLISRLNGNKVLVIGNHDKYTLQNKKFDKSLFLEIVDYKEIKYNDKYIVMSHYPIASFNRQDNGGMCLYGHIHSNKLNSPIPHAYNVGMDVNNYRPVDINNFIKLDNLCDIKTDRHSNI